MCTIITSSLMRLYVVVLSFIPFLMKEYYKFILCDCHKITVCSKWDETEYKSKCDRMWTAIHWKCAKDLDSTRQRNIFIRMTKFYEFVLWFLLIVILNWFFFLVLKRLQTCCGGAWSIYKIPCMFDRSPSFHSWSGLKPFRTYWYNKKKIVLQENKNEIMGDFENQKHQLG